MAAGGLELVVFVGLPRLLDGALAAGRSVVVDNTNPAPEDRALLVAAARARGAAAVAIWFPASVRQCLARNQRRQGRARVPEVEILATAKRLRPPSTEEGLTGCGSPA